MKLSQVIKVWDILHVKPRADLGYCDLQDAIDHVVGIENDIYDGPPVEPDSHRPSKTGAREP